MPDRRIEFLVRLNDREGRARDFAFIAKSFDETASERRLPKSSVPPPRSSGPVRSSVPRPPARRLVLDE